MGWYIRRAVADDVKEIARVNVASWRSAYRGIVPDQFLDTMRPLDRYDRWIKVVTSSTATTLVAVDDTGRIGSYCVVTPARDAGVGPETGELAAIYADPELRGTGAGHAVHEAGIAKLSGEGFCRAVLWVFCDNAPSRRFYEAHGWTEDPIRQYYRVEQCQIEEMRYSRELPNSDWHQPIG